MGGRCIHHAGSHRPLAARIGRSLLAAVLGLLVLAAAAQAADPLPKAISMSGPQPLREDNHPNDYRSWGNRQYFKDSHTAWVKLWVSWYARQQSYAAPSRDGSWNNLTGSATGSAYLKRLDGQIRAANDDGVRTVVTVYQAFPTWATGATGQDPLSSKGAERKLPSNLTTNGPWAWFVGYLSARYNGAYNATGPHKPAKRETTTAYYGNSSRAKVDAIEVVNEPNTLYWPLDNIVGATATMMRSAATVSSQWGKQTIVAPATSDSPDPGAARAGVSMDWQAFTSQLLTALAGWHPPGPLEGAQHNYKDDKDEEPASTSRAQQTIDLLHAAHWAHPALLRAARGGCPPPVPVEWSQHNYKDDKYEDPASTSRAKQTIDLLHAASWPNPELWLTEGGYNLGSAWADAAARDAQAAKIQKSYEAMRTIPEVTMWTQHGINDIASNSFKSGLRDDFDYALPGPGSARPAWTTWLGL